MDLLRHFVLITLFFGFGVVNAKDDHMAIEKEAAALSMYINSFGALSGVIEDLVERRIFSHEQKEELIFFLKSKNVDTSSKIPQSAVSGATIKWGSNTTTFFKDKKYQNEEGKILRINHKISFSEKLEKIWSFNDRKNFSILSIFFIEANAADKPRDAEPTINNAVMNFLGITVDATFEDFENPVGRPAKTAIEFLLWPAGTVDGLARRYLWPTRNLLGGKVTCGAGNSFKAEVLDYASWYEAYNYWKGNPKGIASCEKQYDLNDYCSFLRANINFAETFVVKDKTVAISEDTLKKHIFPGQILPKCDEKSIATVKTYLEKRLQFLRNPVTVISPETKEVPSNSTR